jgi:hypothetical protein
MLEDLADLFERAAADGTPIREVVGEHPEEFVEAFVHNYHTGPCWWAGPSEASWHGIGQTGTRTASWGL